jgi:hypothetical protein
MKLRVSGFDWDDGNRTKCEKRGVSIAEIEALFRVRRVWRPTQSILPTRIASSPWEGSARDAQCSWLSRYEPKAVAGLFVQ